MTTWFDSVFRISTQFTESGIGMMDAAMQTMQSAIGPLTGVAPAERRGLTGLDLSDPRQWLTLPLQLPLSLGTLATQLSLQMLHSTSTAPRSEATAAVSTQQIGETVSTFTLPDLRGVQRTLISFLEGKKGLVVLFWSETCSHCMRYDPYLNAFAARHPDIGLVAVASRQGEVVEQIRATAAARHLTFPILYDASGVVARQWCTQQTPRAFLLNTESRLMYRGAIDNFKYPGDPDYQAYLEPAIEAFLAGRPIERAETASFGCAIQSVYYVLPKPLASGPQGASSQP
jgi:thiol-disulfide isomerase/thioredoxin